MQISIDNNSWIDVLKFGKYYTISATGNNGNEVVIDRISEKYFFQMFKDIKKIPKFV